MGPIGGMLCMCLAAGAGTGVGGERTRLAQNGGSLASKIDLVFRTVRHPDGREYSLREVAEGVERQSGGRVTVTHAYLSQLRRGVRDNPTLQQLEALAGFFGVDPACLLAGVPHGEGDYGPRIRAELELVRQLRETGALQLAQRAAGLDSDGVKAIELMVEVARRAHGLD